MMITTVWKTTIDSGQAILVCTLSFFACGSAASRCVAQNISSGTLHQIHESMLNVQWNGITNDGLLSFSLPSRDLPLAYDQILLWEKHPQNYAHAPQAVILLDTTILSGRLLSLTNGSIFLNHSSLGMLDIPLTRVGTLIFDTTKHAPEQYVDAWMLKSTEAEDVFYLKSGDIYRGIWNNADSIGDLVGTSTPRSIRFKQLEDTQNLSVDQLAAIRLSPILKPFAKPEGVRLKLFLQDGSQLLLTDWETRDDKLSLSTAQFDLELPANRRSLFSQTQCIVSGQSNSTNKYEMLTKDDLLDYRIIKPWTFQPDITQEPSLAGVIFTLHSPSRSVFSMADSWSTLCGVVRLGEKRRPETITADGRGLSAEESSMLDDASTTVRILVRRAGKLSEVYRSRSLEQFADADTFALDVSGSTGLVILVESADFRHSPPIYLEQLRLVRE